MNTGQVVYYNAAKLYRFIYLCHIPTLLGRLMVIWPPNSWSLTLESWFAERNTSGCINNLNFIKMSSVVFIVGCLQCAKMFYICKQIKWVNSSFQISCACKRAELIVGSQMALSLHRHRALPAEPRVTRTLCQWRKRHSHGYLLSLSEPYAGGERERAIAMARY